MMTLGMSLVYQKEKELFRLSHNLNLSLSSLAPTLTQQRGVRGATHGVRLVEKHHGFKAKGNSQLPPY